MTREVLLELKDIRKYFPVYRGLLRRQVSQFTALDGISLNIYRGETVGIVGESGCGKTTLGRCIMQLTPPTSGSVIYHQPNHLVDLTRLTPHELRTIRQKIQIVFQDSLSSLNPVLTVFSSFSEPLKIHGVQDKAERYERICALLDDVGLSADFAFRYPRAFSGGERQRLCIARALSVEPDLMIYDEAVSSLDVSIQAQMLNLLKKIQKERNLTYLFISHNLSVVEYISDRIAVMYLGKLVEVIAADDLTRQACHPYTRALLDSLPTLDQVGVDFKPDFLLDERPDSRTVQTGCRFYSRCRHRSAYCRTQEPPLQPLRGDPGHLVACHRY